MHVFKNRTPGQPRSDNFRANLTVYISFVILVAGITLAITFGAWKWFLWAIPIILVIIASNMVN